MIGPAPDITRNEDNTWTVSIDNYTNGYPTSYAANGTRFVYAYCQDVNQLTFEGPYDGSTTPVPGVYNPFPGTRSSEYKVLFGWSGYPYAGTQNVTTCVGDSDRLIVFVVERAYGSAPKTATLFNVTSTLPSNLQDSIAEDSYDSL